MPSLSSFLDTEKPTASVGTMIWLIPRCPPSSEVRASRHSQSACRLLVIHIFEPLITHSSPSRTALVRSPATSDPASGSLTAIEHTWVPARAGAR